MARLVLSLLGPFEATLDGKPLAGFESNKARALLAYLAAEMHRPQRREAVAELLWPGQPPGEASANLRHTLASLRTTIQDRTADPPFILANLETLQFNREADAAVDLLQFNALIGGAQPRSVEDCGQAIALVRGPFLEGFTLDNNPGFEAWITTAREQTDLRLVHALAVLVHHAVARGQFSRAIEWTQRQLALQPWNEEIHRQLIWLLAVDGRRAEALRQAEACRHLLADELDVEPGAEIGALVERIRAGQPDLGAVRGQDGEWLRAVPAPVAVRPRHNLPAIAAPFFGREAELAQIAERLADSECRLLTVVGPGGVGKTRLALEAAGRQVDRFADGVFVVFLASVEQDELLAGEILHALDIAASGAPGPEQRLRDYLRDKEMLLVLDNLEQLKGSAPLLADLAAVAPRLKLLVTSRERLHLSLEWLIPLEGLDAPSAPEPLMPGVLPGEDAPQAVSAYGAVKLFVHVARRVNPGFALTPAAAPDVARICRQLGGFPLALELAAAWVRLLPLSEIVAELDRSPALLAATLGDVPTRHRSMDAVFDHSWNLLPPREQSLLRQLAVFRGGFTRAGAHDVAGATVADLAALVDKSWLRPGASGRYDMHELVRQYCEHRLEEEHEAAVSETPAEVRGRHCHFIGAAMSAMRQRLNRSAGAVDEMMPEMGNLQAAWRFATQTLDSRAALDILFGTWFLGECLGWFAYVRQTLEAGAVTLEERIRQNPHDPSVVQHAALLLAWIRTAQRDLNSNLGTIEEARACLDKLRMCAQWVEPENKNLFWEALVIIKSAWQAEDEGDFEAQRRLAQQARSLFGADGCEDQFYGGEAGVAFWQSDSDQVSATAEFHLGNYAEAERWMVSSISLGDSIGEGRFKGWRLGLFAEWALLAGDLERAQRFADDGTRLVETYGDRVGMAFLQMVAGEIAAAANRATEAREHLEQALGAFRQCGQLWRHLEALNHLGLLALAQADSAEARRRFEEALAVFARAGTAHCHPVTATRLGLGWTALAEGNLAEARDTFTRILAAERGRAAWETMDAIAGLARVLHAEERWEEAVELLALVAAHPFTAYALRRQAGQWLTELESALGPDLFAAHAAAGRARDLDATLAALTA